jgi:hypothetical protein
VIYPDNESGQVYLNEVWRQAQAKNVALKSIAAYPKNGHDFRETAQQFLGLKYPREREEELKILGDVYAQEKGSTRRVQTLPPEIDFDWVFLASFPYEAIRESTLRVLSTLFQLVLRQVQKLHLNVTEKMKKQQWLRLKNLQARTLVNNL